jgi:hypothetical protein
MHEGTAAAHAHPYSRPEIVDYGHLQALTASQSVVYGVKALGLAASFAGSVVGTIPPDNPTTPSDGPGSATSVANPPGGGAPPSGPETAGNSPSGSVSETLGSGSSPDEAGSPGGGSGSGGGGDAGGSGGGSGGGGTLPFTGFAVIVSAMIGATLVSTGELIRRAARRRAGDRP